MAAPRITREQALEVVRAIEEHGSRTAAARALDMGRSMLIARQESALVHHGLAPHKAPDPAKALETATEPMHRPFEGQRVKGTSTLVDGDSGARKLQWIKTTEDQYHAQLAMQAAANALAEKLKPRPVVMVPRLVKSDLATMYTLTDSHVGMLAWGKESGEPWDLNIAERCLTETILQMIDAAPESELGIVNQLGDFLHFDSLVPLTPTSKHVLDADSRYQKVVEVAVRILERVINASLEKHSRVLVLMNEGNHDMAGSVWLRIMFAKLYERNKRCIVEESPNPYVAHRWGNTMLGFHHGHLTRKQSLPMVFAEQYAKMWGQTKYRYIHVGHMHHVEEKEYPGTKVIQHPTLAAKDAHAARGGWLSKRQATSMTYSKKNGEVARATFIPVD